MPTSDSPQHADQPRHTEHERGAVAAQISREIVQLHANLYGRGPTKAKTHVYDSYVLCLLEDVFTPAERTLVEAGKAEQVHSTRAAFKDAVGEEFTAIVEQATGRTVRAFMSTVSVEPELASELFLLEPAAGASQDGGDPLRDDL
jgi:uncharacterized protein YbcI